MRAVVFDLSIPKYLLATAVGTAVPALYHGAPSCLSVREVAEPVLRGPAWVKVAVEACGLCGSDLSTIFFKMSPALSPFSSMPCVLGHEFFGYLKEVGGDARAAGWKEGDRVAVNPTLGCLVRGIEPMCASCASGHDGTCHHAGGSAGGLAPGFTIGYHRELAGGMAEAVLAHHRQLFRLPNAVPDRRAVLTEPFSVGLHAVLRRPPRPEEQVLIIGGGMIAYAVLSALRLLGYRNQVTQLLLEDYQAALARRLGADEVLEPSKSVDPIDEVVRITGARRHKPVLGPDVLTGGFGVVYECIGSARSWRDALTFVAAQGALVAVGCVGMVGKLDLTAVWHKRLDVLGSVCYGQEGPRGHTFALAIELLAEPEATKLDSLVTHTFGLERVQDAVLANVRRTAFESVKTILRTRP